MPRPPRLESFHPERLAAKEQLSLGQAPASLIAGRFGARSGRLGQDLRHFLAQQFPAVLRRRSRAQFADLERRRQQRSKHLRKTKPPPLQNHPCRLVCRQGAEQQKAAPNQLRLNLLEKPAEPLRVTAVIRIAGRCIRVGFPEELQANLVLDTIQKVQAEGLRFREGCQRRRHALFREEDMLHQLGRGNRLRVKPPAPANRLEVRLAQLQEHFLEHRLFGHTTAN